jgi:hypothetical protein
MIHGDVQPKRGETGVTAPRTPDDESRGDQTRVEPGDQESTQMLGGDAAGAPESEGGAAEGSQEGPAVPPPPQWLQADDQAPGAHLLPEPPELPEFGSAPPPPPEGLSDKTVSDIDIRGNMRTQVFSQEKPGSQGPQSAPVDSEATAFVESPVQQSPTGEPRADTTMTDVGAYMPSAGERGVGSDPTREEPARGSQNAPQPPAPEAEPPTEVPAGPPPSDPFPYAQQTPPAADPFPYAQQVPSPPQEAAPEPFPYAQNIPSPQQSAPEPFPYAQEIPSAQPPAAEPFPYAQEIPAAPRHPAPEPFPYAQEIPGASKDQTVTDQAMPGPAAPPPPVIDEPWRTPGKGKKKRSGGGRKLGKPILIGVAGLAVVALAAGGGYVFLSGGDDDEGGGGGGGATLAGSVFPVDSSARTDGRDQELGGVASVGSTTVAIGGESDPQGSRGLFLVSADGGRTFKPAKVDGAGGAVPAPGDVPAAVGGSTRGWVAIGTRAGGAGAVWTSENGQTWHRQPDAVGDVFGQNSRVRRIVGTGDGFVVIGEISQKGDFTDSVPAAWLSADGQRWEARVGDQLGLGVKKGKVQLIEAAASGNVVLLEAVQTPDPKKPAAFRRVWVSGDGGRSWSDSPVPTPKNSRGLMIGGGPAGFLAMREIREKDKAYAKTFTSKDGKSWTEAGKLEASGYRRIGQVLADEKGYGAVVVRGRDILISRSTDGKTWKDAGSLTSQSDRVPASTALAGTQAIMVGRQSGGGDNDPMVNVWDERGTAIPVDLAKMPGVLRRDHAVIAVAATTGSTVAVGSQAGDAAVWTSQDGTTWKAAQGLGAAFTRPGTQQLRDVAAGQAGFLAVGDGPLVVTSADGTTWQAADGAAQFRSGSKGRLVTNATAAGTPGFVIVGAEGDSAATWFSTDLKSWSRGTSAAPNALESKSGDSRWILNVASGQSGFTAVGGVHDPKTGNHPTVWSSADGKKWAQQQLPLPSGVTAGHLTQVAVHGSMVTAAGVAATAKGLGWLGYASSDGGKTWHNVSAPGGDADVSVTSLSETPKGFAATATTGKPGETDVVSMTSADGSSWTTTKPGGEGLGGPGDQWITGQVSFKNRLLGVGRTADSAGEQPVLWNRPIP